MKILFFINSLRSGGKERRFIELLKGIQLSSNINFEIVVMSEETHYQDVFKLSTKIHYLIRKSKKDIFSFYKFYKICKNYKPDIIHCWDSMTAIYSIPASKILGIKLVNGMIADAPIQRNLLNKNWIRGKLSFPLSNIILANSKAGLIAYRAPKSKSFFIHNGFDFKRITHIKNENDIKRYLNINTKYVIGMVASYSASKDYKTFFNSAQLLLALRKDITFLAIGSDTDTIPVKDLIEKKNIDHFRLLGKQVDIESLINIMDIGVLATFTEGISNSIMEYMAMGKPVVATAGGGTCEIILDRETGFLVETSDSNDLVEKLEFLLNNLELRKRMGQQGLERIQTLFPINKMVTKYISLYTQLKENNPISIL